MSTKVKSMRIVFKPEGVKKMLRSRRMANGMKQLADEIARDAETVSGENYETKTHMRPGRVVGIVHAEHEGSINKEAKHGYLNSVAYKNRGGVQ